MGRALLVVDEMRRYWRRYRPPELLPAILGGLLIGWHGFLGTKIGLFAGMYFLSYGLLGGFLVGVLASQHELMGRLETAFRSSFIAAVLGITLQFVLSVIDDVIIASRYPIMPLNWAGTDKVPPDLLSRIITFVMWESYLIILLWLPIVIVGVLFGTPLGVYFRVLIVNPIWKWVTHQFTQAHDQPNQ